MADAPLSALGVASPLSDTDLLYVVQTPGVGGRKAELSLMAEYIRDTVAAFVIPGTNVTVVHNDATNTLTISASGGGGGGAVNNYFPGGWF